MKNLILLIILTLSLGCQSAEKESKKIDTSAATLKALIIDGENNHGIWPKTTMMMKDFLEETSLFQVDIYRKKYLYQGPHHDAKELDSIQQLLTMYPLDDGKTYQSVKEITPDPDFAPDFEKYDVVVSNMGWQSSTWSDEVITRFERYMANGGGLVIIHAANNAWGDWDEFNKMIGLGAWGDRNTESGPYVYYDDEGTKHVDPSEGQCGSHGAQHEFVMTTRAPEHAIMRGLPTAWLHAKDELYDRMRGPAENMTVLATAFSDVEGNAPPWDPKTPGTGRHEPLLMAIDYGKGHVFHSGLGHMDYSMECVGFITTFQRGTEWAATGKVTQAIPDDFPTEGKTSVRAWEM